MVHRLLFILSIVSVTLLLTSCEESATDPERQAPYDPAVPSPADGATLTSPLQYLSWNCTDPNGDALTFQVYLGTDDDPPLIAENLTSNVYFPEDLEQAVTYHWKVVATDDAGNSTTSPVWHFTTAVIPEIDDFSLTTSLVYNVPFTPSIYYELGASAILDYSADPSNIDSVLLISDEAGIYFPMSDASTGNDLIYTITARADTLPGGDLYSLVDHEFYCKVVDYMGNEILSNPSLISRIFDSYPQPDYPLGGLPYPEDTLTVVWYEYQASFSFTFEVGIYAGSTPDYFWNQTGIPSTETSLIVDYPLSFGTYHWRIKAVDQFGNSALSNKAYFVIQ
ncbi:hypothetical protein KKA00_07040 [bacterium]|nr:hypothetical protein [bacterium]